MKKDIILAGVGGQGILSIAAVIGMAAMDAGLEVKQAEVHGMSQRGGAVQSHLRLKDSMIYSDLIPEGSCDIILSVEPMEALRYLSFLGSDGWVIANSKAFVNIPNYPEMDRIKEAYEKLQNSRLIDADALAAAEGSKKVSNIVMLGAAVDKLEIPLESVEKAIRNLFGRKGEEVVNMNLAALKAGMDLYA